jgi:hypothetical protein
LKQAAIDIIRNPLTLFGTVGTSQSLLRGLLAR